MSLLKPSHESCPRCAGEFNRPEEINLLSDGSGYKRRYAVCDHVMRMSHHYCISYLNLNKELHRLDGPAEILNVMAFHRDEANSNINLKYKQQQSWWENDRRHRLNGPAVLTTNSYYHDVYSSREYWIEGSIIAFNEYEFEEFIKYCNLPLSDKVQLKLIV